MESDFIQNQEENGQQKKPEPLTNADLREAARTFLRVKKRVEIAKAQKNAEKQLLQTISSESGKSIKSTEFNLNKILELLIIASEKNLSSEVLLNFCKDLNMSQIEYINFNSDPLFSNGYNLIFNLDTNEGRLEIIDFTGKILQSGFQIIYRPKLFSRQFKYDFHLIHKFLKNYYLNEIDQLVNRIRLYNFANDLSQCYISKSRINGSRIINFRIMNKDNWSMANTSRTL